MFKVAVTVDYNADPAPVHGVCGTHTEPTTTSPARGPNKFGRKPGYTHGPMQTAVGD